VLPGFGHEGAVQVAESIRQKAQGLKISHEGSQMGFVTVSIGCATCLAADGEDPDRLLASADEQLYRAKSLGRNQVQFNCPDGDNARAGRSIPFGKRDDPGARPGYLRSLCR